MTIEERLTRLEVASTDTGRRVGLLAAFIIGLLMMGAVASFMGAGGGLNEELRTRSLIIVDDQGKSRAVLCVLKDGAGLALTDDKGQQRIMLAIGKDGPMLALRDETGRARATLNTSKDGTGLILTDEKDKSRIILGLTKERTGLRIWDENGTGIGQVP